MQVTLKTLQQQTFKIDIDPEETVRAAGRGERGARVGAAWEGPAEGGGGDRSAAALWAEDEEGLEADGVEQYRPARALEAAARSAWSWGLGEACRPGRWTPGLKCTGGGGTPKASPPPSDDPAGCGGPGAGYPR